MTIPFCRFFRQAEPHLRPFGRMVRAGFGIAAVLTALIPLETQANQCSAIFAASSTSLSFSFQVDDVYSTAPQWVIPRSQPFEGVELRQSTFLTGRGGDAVTTPTVRVSSTVAGRFGGKINVVRRTGRAWHSTYRFMGDAFQGDPRAFTIVTSPATAYAFGFGRVGTNEMTAPDAVELQGAGAAMSRKLRELGYEEIPIRFVPTDGESLGSNREFIEAWAYRGEIPIAIDGPIYFHDIGYHASNVVFPPGFVRQSQRMFRRFIEFVNFARARAQSDPEMAWFNQDWEDMIYWFLGKQLDSGGGNFWIDYVNRFNPEATAETRRAIGPLQVTMLKLSGLTRTPDESLENFFSPTQHSWEKRLGLKTVFDRSANWRSKVDPDGVLFKKLHSLIAEFRAAHPSQEASLVESFTGEASPNPEAQANGLLRAIDRRRIELSRAARALLSSERGAD